jgi:hypothetical protein
MGGAEIEQKENPAVTGAQIKNSNLKSRRAVAIIPSARRANVSLNGALSGVIRGLYLTGRRVIILGDRLTTDQFGIVRDRKRPARQITLNLVATFLYEERMLGFGLDPFRSIGFLDLTAALAARANCANADAGNQTPMRPCPRHYVRSTTTTLVQR